MSALDTLSRICETELVNANLKYCFVTDKKMPIRFDGIAARPNQVDDFVELQKLLSCDNIESFAGIGISIQASGICAIDVDHCFSSAFDISSADERAIDILSMLKDFAYCEFSFSGKGLRVLFLHDIIENYSEKFYIKNEKVGIEYYQPASSFRYVTLTGNVISNHKICKLESETLLTFLNKYMQRTIKVSFNVKTQQIKETRTFEELLKLVKIFYFKNNAFQNLWFSKAPGSGKDESERDYHILAFLFENITQDKEMLRLIFEESPYFKSKDFKHVCKWTNQNHRYFEYVYSMIRRTKC